MNRTNSIRSSASMMRLRLSDYQVGEELGSGTVGSIRAAIHKQDQIPVAIKFLHPLVSNDALVRARFEREMLILGRIQHPNIIGYFGGGITEDGRLFYVMELIDGGTVKDLLASQGKLSWPVVVELARQTCSALQCAHNLGVVHRDLKPGNLFLTTSGILKLGDFGIARDQSHADLTTSGMTVGTHAYMAPEQITGDETISGKADLYSLGCCLYEMLTGKKAFLGAHFAELFEKHLRGPIPDVRDAGVECPAVLSDLIGQCLAKSPEDRPFNARAVQGALMELLGEREPDGSDADVGADEVTSKGAELLRRQIAMSKSIAAPKEISWFRIICFLVGLAVLIWLAVFASNQ